MKRAFVLTLASLLGACANRDPPQLIDTSCDRFAHISANDAQLEVFKANWDVMESYADQVVAHNIEYEKSCIQNTK